MDANEIRAIRGSLSRPAFARLLGVTSLTVLRWELPTGNKEARRPRARMIEELRRLAANGVGLSAEGAPDDDEDDGASEPLSEPPASARDLTSAAHGRSAQEARALSLFARLFNAGWQSAERELSQLLQDPALDDADARALATLGMILVQIVARLDLRGALAALRPFLEQAERGAAPRHVAARTHVLAATLHGAPDARYFDPGRVNVHGALAETLLDPEEDDLRVLVVMARASAAAFVGPHVMVRAYQAGQVSVERARGLLSRTNCAELRAHISRLSGDLAGMERWEAEAMACAEQLGMPQMTLTLYGHRAMRSLRSGARPEQVLELVARARAAAAGAMPAEPFVRVLAAECEALSRLARFAEAKQTLDDALAYAALHELSPFVLMMPAARLLLMMNRTDEIERLADRLAQRVAALPNGKSSLAELYVIMLRAVAAFPRDPALSAQLAGRGCQALELLGGEGSDFLAHDAHLILILARLLSADMQGAQEAMRSAELLYDRRPSLWHAAVLRRLVARRYALDGRLAEAEQRLKGALASLQAMGDVVQSTHCELDLALLARLMGSPDAEARVAAANAAFERLGMWRAELPGHLPASLMMPGARRAAAVSLTERLASGVERLALRGLTHELYLSELERVLGELLGEQAPRLVRSAGAVPEARSPREEYLALPAEHLRAECGALSAEQRAALRTLFTVAALCFGNASGAQPAALAPAHEPDRELPGFIAAAPATRQLRREIGQLARANATILITGESGSGKEVVAQALHDLSPRADKAFIAFNCAAVPRELFEGQLFGYRKGAFTGASNDSPGVIRAADGGTLFLDEIGELPLELQPKLLRFLENGEVTPLGEQRPRRVSVRVLAATHRDLARLVREGKFREDLYYRLNVVPLVVPPLRERKEDIVALARMFVGRTVERGAQAPELSADAVHALKAHSWPGNVRELRNVIERALAYAPVPEVLEASHLRIHHALAAV